MSAWMLAPERLRPSSLDLLRSPQQLPPKPGMSPNRGLSACPFGCPSQTPPLSFNPIFLIKWSGREDLNLRPPDPNRVPEPIESC